MKRTIGQCCLTCSFQHGFYGSNAHEFFCDQFHEIIKEWEVCEVWKVRPALQNVS